MQNELDYSAMRFWWDIMQSVFILGMGVYVWMKSRSQVNTTRIEKVEETLIEHDRRIIKAVSHDDLEVIYTRLNSISRDLSKMEGEFKSHNRLLHSMNDFLRDNK